MSPLKMAGGASRRSSKSSLSPDHSYLGSSRGQSPLPGDGQQDNRGHRRNKLFRRIQMDIRDRERQRSKMGPMEVVNYVDPQRAMAVALGERDIRREILKHRGRYQKMNNSNMLTDEADSPGFLLLHEQAERELRLGNPSVAAAYLDKAVEMQPDDVEVRVLRGRALVLMGHYKAALADADLVLTTLREPRNPGGLAVRGQALYFMGDFEHALVSFRRALRGGDALMTEREKIYIGIKRAEQAIKNAVGDQTDSFFVNVENVLKKLPRGFLGVPWFLLKSRLEEVSDKRRGKQKNCTMAGEREQDRKFLNQMSHDKVYLESIVDKLSGGAKKEVQTALDFLLDRRDFWSQQRPDYDSAMDRSRTKSLTASLMLYYIVSTFLTTFLSLIKW